MTIFRYLIIVFIVSTSTNSVISAPYPTDKNAEKIPPSDTSALQDDGDRPKVNIPSTTRSIPGENGVPCEFVTDQEVKIIPQVARPGYLEPYLDPVFGTKIVRITDPEEAIPEVGGSWQKVARHHYSSDQAWNADQTLLMLDRGTSGRGNLFLDGNTYELLFLSKAPSSEHRWHPTDPDLQIFVKKNQIGTWNVRSQKINIIGRIKGYKNLKFGPYKGIPSRDGTRIAVLGKDKNGLLVAFAYDLATKQKYPDINLHELNISWVSISPLGEYILVHEKTSDRSRIYNLLGSQVGPHWSEYGRPSHFDLTVDDNGDEIAVGVSKSAPDKGRVIKRRLRDGSVTVLTENGYAAHATARNIFQPGWAYVSYHIATNWPPYNCEVAAVKLDGSFTVRRLFHTHYIKSGYLTETHPSVSPDGTKIIWASNWDDPSGRIASYVAEICTNDPKINPQPATIKPPGKKITEAIELNDI